MTPREPVILLVLPIAQPSTQYLPYFSDKSSGEGMKLERRKTGGGSPSTGAYPVGRGFTEPSASPPRSRRRQEAPSIPATRHLVFRPWSSARAGFTRSVLECGRATQWSYRFSSRQVTRQTPPNAHRTPRLQNHRRISRGGTEARRWSGNPEGKRARVGDPSTGTASLRFEVRRDSSSNAGFAARAVGR